MKVSVKRRKTSSKQNWMSGLSQYWLTIDFPDVNECNMLSTAVRSHFKFQITEIVFLFV